MNNLVARLRAVAENQSRVTGGVVRVDTNVFSQAADEIERLEARNARLLAALKRAKDHLEYCGYGDEWERGINDGKDPLDKQIKSALAAEEKEQSK